MDHAESPYPAPEITPETRSYWEAAAEGRLLYKRCCACGEPHFYPRALCPFCFGETEWRQSSGNGVIYSYSVERRAPTPYAIAYVQLAEGPMMMSNIVDCRLDDIRVGQAVKLVFKRSDGGPPLAMFSAV